MCKMLKIEMDQQDLFGQNKHPQQDSGGLLSSSYSPSDINSGITSLEPRSRWMLPGVWYPYT